MTITPNCSSSGQNSETFLANLNSANNNLGQMVQTSSGGRSQPILVKSDHFLSDLAPAESSNNPHPFATRLRGGFNSESEQQTSDESQEAMRIFAASPPDPTSPHFRRQGPVGPKPSHTSSNESLSSGQHRFYRPRSGTNQSNVSGDLPEDSSVNSCTDFKVGAFVSRPVSADTNRNSVDGNDDPLLQLFNLETSDASGNSTAAAVVVEPPPPPAPTKSGGLEEKSKKVPEKKKKDEFVMLDFKTPFSAKTGETTNVANDLGIFFKDVDTAGGAEASRPIGRLLRTSFIKCSPILGQGLRFGVPTQFLKSSIIIL